MRITQRAAFGWGASAATPANPTLGLVIHYDGSNQGLARKLHGACVTYWQQTRRFHMGPGRGWADIGYSFGVCPHGEVLEGRGLGRYQAAQGTTAGNANWYSATLMSGPDEPPTAAQIDAVRQLRAWLMSKGVAGAVRGHRDFVSTTCPGDVLYRMVRDGVFAGKASSEEEGDVSAKDVWKYEIPVPWGSKDNPEWQAKSLLVNTNQRLRAVQATLDAQTETIRQLVDLLAQRDEEIDVEALVARINEAIGQVVVRLDVADATQP
jgi:hypothetical protein